MAQRQDRAQYSWPKIINETMLGSLNEKHCNDRDMVTHTLSVADMRSKHVLGVVSVTRSKHVDLVTERRFHRYVLRVSGTPVRIMEFNDRSGDGKLGKLIATYEVVTGDMIKTEVKK